MALYSDATYLGLIYMVDVFGRIELRKWINVYFIIDVLFEVRVFWGGFFHSFFLLLERRVCLALQDHYLWKQAMPS